jgi:hypothetical protein
MLARTVVVLLLNIETYLSYNVPRTVGTRNRVEERETIVRKTWNDVGYTVHLGSFDNQNTFPAI